MAGYKTIQHCLYEPDDKLEANTGCSIYGDKGGLKSYHYEEMIKRLNDMDGRLVNVCGDTEFIEIGHLLRMLWRRYEKDLTVHTRSLYGGTHEQDIKNKKMKVEGFRFAKNEAGVYGIYTDLVYDTYQKDWSKAYQLTFHGFFAHIDYLANYMDGEFFSSVHSDFRFFAFGKMHQFGEVIIKDVENFLADKSKLDAIHGLSKHDKAPLYDVIGKVLDHDGYSNAKADLKQFRHGLGLFDGEKSYSANLTKCLATDTFAHIASLAIVNPLAFKVLKDCLPDACRMFMDILGIIALRLEKQTVDRYRGKWEDKIYSPPPLTIINSFTKKRIMDQKFPQDIEDIIKKDVDAANRYNGNRSLIIDIARHHLYMAGKTNGYSERYELTYVDPPFCKNINLYEGYYDSVRYTQTMGTEFGDLLRKHEHKLVIHLHPLKKEYRMDTITYRTMFSPGDEACINDDNYKGEQGPLWIGIELFEGNGGTFYADTYISRGWWGLVEKYIPAKHMERIEAKELTPKSHGKFRIKKVVKGEEIKCE